MTNKCLCCGNSLNENLFTINDLPLVDAFLSTSADAVSVDAYTVKLVQCSVCKTIQIESPPDTSDIYKNYIYDSSSSPDLSIHFEKYAKFISTQYEDRSSKVLEIGANDGLLLNKLNSLGYSSLTAVDPSPQTASINIKGIEIINEFFTDKIASQIPSGSQDIIIANNCFSHIPNLCDILSLCGKLLNKSGTLFIEVQSTLDLLENVVFDYIYHEHYFYHTVSSFERCCEIAGLSIYSVTHHPTKGGTYRFQVGHGGNHVKDGSVQYWKYREELAGVHKLNSWNALSSYLQIIKERLLNLISQHNGRIIGYGASATSTVLMRYMELESSISHIVDDNVKRQGLYSPGSGIPVVSGSVLNQEDLCLILAWRHSSYIVPKLDKINTSWIIPLPNISKSTSL